MKRRTPAAAAVVVALAGVLLALLGTPSSLGAYTSKVTNTKNTASSSVWFTCLNQAKDNGGAYFFYELDDASGTAVADTSGNARPGVYSSTGVTRNDVAGPCTADAQGKVVTLNGTSGAIGGAQFAGAAPTNFSEEVWFKTTTTTGGDLFSFSPVQTGTNNQHDRHMYMNNDGKLTVGIYDGAVRTIQSTASYNNNVWHHAVFTVATTGTYKGMRLYVDGALAVSTVSYFTAEAGTGLYPRIGYNSLSGWTNVPTSPFFKGSLADVAFYNSVLTPAQVASHYDAGN